MNKSVILIILGIFAIAGGVIFSLDMEKTSMNTSDFSKYEIQSKWELPDDLEEISGIVWIGENKIASIQDEDGIIFIFNLSSSKIEKRISFGEPGDYEGLSIMGQTAYVLRSDGTIFEISNYQSDKPKITIHKTPLTAKQNLEGLCLDKTNNRLLLAIKNREADSDNYKGVYAFNLETKKLDAKPIFKLNMEDAFLKDSGKKMHKKLRPSEIGIHPKTGEIYILDAKDPKLITMDSSGKFKKLYRLNEDDFNQPEGLTFEPDGKLYISNEAGDESANILRVELK